jgi:hypothetical protein
MASGFFVGETIVIPAAHACRQAPVEPGYGKAGIQLPYNGRCSSVRWMPDTLRRHSGMTSRNSSYASSHPRRRVSSLRRARFPPSRE